VGHVPAVLVALLQVEFDLAAAVLHEIAEYAEIGEEWDGELALRHILGGSGFLRCPFMRLEAAA
jgi:hypothetical protein